MREKLTAYYQAQLVGNSVEGSWPIDMTLVTIGHQGQ